MLPSHLTHVFPDSTDTNAAGHLTIGGCDATDLVEQYGTPLVRAGRSHPPFSLPTIRAGFR